MFEPYIPRPMVPVNDGPKGRERLPYGFSAIVPSCADCVAWQRRGYDLAVFHVGREWHLTWRLSRN